MRLLPCLLILGLALPALAQREGTYRPLNSAPMAWRINEHHTLIWAGDPYLPIGARVHGVEGIAAAKAAGLNDVLLELPASGIGWTDCIEELEKNKQRYLIAINSVAPTAKGFAIEPESFRVPGILKDTEIDVPIPGASSALVVLVTRRDGMIHLSQRQPIEGGRLKMKVEAPNSLEHILLIYPETVGLSTPDYWEGFDAHRDALLASLRRYPLGRGLRGIVNPIGESIQLQTSSPHFVPSSAYFRMEFRAHLQDRYKSLDTVVKMWSIAASDIESWDQIVRLVPLWSESRGIPRLWDPVKERLYTCDSKRSTIWTDIQAVVSAASAKRISRLMPSVRSIVDVPIVQEWAGWSSLFDGPRSGLDGIAMRARGSQPSLLAESGSRAASSVLSRKDALWLPATDIALSGVPELLPNVIEDLTSMGARAWFVRTSDKAAMSALAALLPDSAVAQWSPTALFFPESAMNPAMPQGLPGGRWWLPSPAAGDRIDLGRQFSAYRYLGGSKSFVALWSATPMPKVKLRLLEPKLAKVTLLDGSPAQVKVSKNGIEVAITEVPILIEGTNEIPVPEPAMAEVLLEFERITKIAEDEHKDATEEMYLFRDAKNGFDRNPGGSFVAMRTQVDRIVRKLATWEWIEAESSRNHSLSEVKQESGLSGGASLVLRAQISPNPEGFFAEYQSGVRTTLDQEVWLAARVPAEQRSLVRVEIGDQTLQMPAESVSPYGAGFAWYRLGVTRLAGSKAKIVVRVTGADGTDLALDALLLYPGTFMPRGPFMPGLGR